MLPDQCDQERLLRWASLYSIDPVAAAAATRPGICDGTTGATVPTGTLWQRADGAQYQHGRRHAGAGAAKRACGGRGGWLGRQLRTLARP